MSEKMNHTTEEDASTPQATPGRLDEPSIAAGRSDADKITGRAEASADNQPDRIQDNASTDSQPGGRHDDAVTESSHDTPSSDDSQPYNEHDPFDEGLAAPADDAPEQQGPVVVIKGLHKAFKDHKVLNGVDLHVNKGENLVILGKSGSGKSVLIKCLVGLERPDEGSLEVFGQNLDGLSYPELNALRVRIGFLFQNAALYDSMTVRENLLFPLRQHKKNMTKEKKNALVEEMLENVGLLDSIDQMPSKLSGGQMKRIGLARTLILRPQLMLYDEPTTGLDTGTSKEISELMVHTKNKFNISSITITHDMPCAKMTADRIIMMKEGQVAAEGTYAELEKSDDEWIQSFFY